MWWNKEKTKNVKVNRKNKRSFISDYESRLKELEEKETNKEKLIEKSICEFIIKWESIEVEDDILIISLDGTSSPRIDIGNFFDKDNDYLSVEFMADEFRYNSIRFKIKYKTKAYDYCLEHFFDLYYKKEEKSYEKAYERLGEKFDKLCKIDKRLVALLRNDKLDKLGD
jgi:hypothetical protein